MNNKNDALLSRVYKWSRIVYVIVTIVWCLRVFWRVTSGTALETRPDSPTLIRLDLLQALAFVVAWSILLYTITIAVVNKGRDLESATEKTSWEIDKLEAEKRERTEFSQEMARVEAKVNANEDRLATLILAYAERLAEENEQLRKQLKDRPSGGETQND